MQQTNVFGVATYYGPPLHEVPWKLRMRRVGRAAITVALAGALAARGAVRHLTR